SVLWAFGAQIDEKSWSAWPATQLSSLCLSQPLRRVTSLALTWTFRCARGLQPVTLEAVDTGCARGGAFMESQSGDIGRLDGTWRAAALIIDAILIGEGCVRHGRSPRQRQRCHLESRAADAAGGTQMRCKRWAGQWRCRQDGCP